MFAYYILGYSSDILQAKLGLAAAAVKDTEILCSVKLPEPKPLANIDEETAARFVFENAMKFFSNQVCAGVSLCVRRSHHQLGPCEMCSADLVI